MSPWLDRTLHPQLALRMNLRIPFRSQHSLIWIPAYLSILIFQSTIDIAADRKPRNQNRYLRFSPGRSCCSNQLQSSGATCVQKLDGSRDSAIHTRYRILLRSSSMREPRYPLPRVVWIRVRSLRVGRPAGRPPPREAISSVPWRRSAPWVLLRPLPSRRRSAA